MLLLQGLPVKESPDFCTGSITFFFFNSARLLKNVLENFVAYCLLMLAKMLFTSLVCDM